MDINVSEELLAFPYPVEVLNYVNKIFINNEINAIFKEDILYVALVMGQIVVSHGCTLDEVDLVVRFLIMCANNPLFYDLIANIRSNCNNFKKIIIIAKIGFDCDNLDINAMVSFLNSLINMNVHNSMYILTQKLINFGILKKYARKFMIIFKAIINSDTDYQRSDEGINYIYEILTNEDILNYSDSEYQKVVALVFNNVYWYPLYVAMRNLTLEKFKAAIYYYYQILPKYFPNDNYANLDSLEKEFSKDIFSVPLNLRLKSLNIGEYVRILSKILVSNNPVSEAIIVNHDLEDKKENVAIDSLKNVLDSKDCDMANIFISPLMIALNINDYTKYINVVKDLVQKYNEETDGVIKKLLEFKIRALRELCKLAIYKDNLERLDYVIGIICGCEREIIINSIVTFASSIYSVYYTDDEFKKVIEVLSDTSDIIGRERTYESSYFILNSLFLNEAIPFVDKELVIDIAKTSNRTQVLEMAHKLHNLGVRCRNMYVIMHGSSNGEFVNNARMLESSEVMKLLLISER